MARRSGVEVSVKDDELRTLMRAVRAEADGKQLRKDLTTDLKTAVSPGVAAVQGQLRAIPHHSRAEGSPRLGAYLAARVKPQVRLSGRASGVAIRVGQTPNLRGFRMAARLLNRESWRHMVYGNPKVWVTQHSPIAGYFDDTLARDRPVYRATVIAVLDKAAERLKRRS